MWLSVRIIKHYVYIEATIDKVRQHDYSCFEVLIYQHFMRLIQSHRVHAIAVNTAHECPLLKIIKYFLSHR